MSDRYAKDRHDGMPATMSPFQIRGRFLTALALRVDTPAPGDAFYAQLDEQLRRTPDFFAGAPMVLDLAQAATLRDGGALGDLVAQLRRRKLRVFGVQNADDLPEEVLQALGLIHVTPGRDAALPDRQAERGQSASEPEPRAPRNRVVRSPVRSGQMISAENGDLTVVGSVASGAELVARGNIHIYGSLHGRAMAGAYGDETARIFCQDLNAELVAIAGLYQTSETIEGAARQRCTHIYLEDERLRMEVIA